MADSSLNLSGSTQRPNSGQGEGLTPNDTLSSSQRGRSDHAAAYLYDNLVDADTERDSLGSQNHFSDFKEARTKMDKMSKTEVHTALSMVHPLQSLNKETIPEDAIMIKVIKCEAKQAVFERARNLVIKAEMDGFYDWNVSGVRLVHEGPNYPTFGIIAFLEGRQPSEMILREFRDPFIKCYGEGSF